MNDPYRRLRDTLDQLPELLAQAMAWSRRSIYQPLQGAARRLKDRARRLGLPRISRLRQQAPRWAAGPLRLVGRLGEHTPVAWSQLRDHAATAWSRLREHSAVARSWLRERLRAAASALRERLHRRARQTEQPAPGTPAPPAESRPRRRIWLAATAIVAGCMLTACSAAATYVMSAYQEIPAHPEVRWNLASIVYDRHGNELTRLHAGEDRVFVPLDQVPAHVQDAFVAIEDARFWQHGGIDLYRLAGALWHDLEVWVTGEGGLQGASTITQQLAKNAFLTHERTLRRKVKEALLAIRLEQRMSKEEILEKYLNQIFFGRNYYGIGAAARGYFGKEPAQLTLGEAALLAGMVQSPNGYDPVKHADAALARRRTVLEQMVRQGKISAVQAEQAAAEPLALAGTATGEGGPAGPAAPHGNHFTDYVLQVLTEPGLARRHGLAEPLSPEAVFAGGYHIHTTFDPGLQTLAEQAVAQVMDPNKAQHFAMPADEPDRWIQAAVVVMEPDTGAVRALVGGRRRGAQRELNRATGTLRQPGSTFKPIAAYIPAMERLGLGTASVVDDAPLRYEKKTGGMWPENYDRKYLGLTPLRDGIRRSVNAMAVRLGQMVGPDHALEYARKLGITTMAAEGPANDRGPATALGGLTRGVSLLELTSAYATMANLGVRAEPQVITRIEDHTGKVIYAAAPAPQPVIRPTVAWMMVDMLKGVVRSGTARAGAARVAKWAVGGKTGTTENNHDAWFVGFSRQLAVGVWNGYDQPQPLPYAGSGAPVEIWARIMEGAHAEPPPDWKRPPGLKWVTVCAKTGLLPSRLCPETTGGWFETAHLPREQDDRFWTSLLAVRNDQGGWLKWQAGCLAFPERRTFLLRPEFPRHPTRPHDPRWIPADAALAPPQEECAPLRFWDRDDEDDKEDRDRLPGIRLPGQGKGRGRKG